MSLDRKPDCIRPVCSSGFLKQYLYINDKLAIKPAARIEFDLTPTQIAPPHIEDRAFYPVSIVSKGVCNTTEWENVLINSSYTRVANIYNGLLKDYSWVKPGANTKSLSTLSNPTSLNVELSTWGVTLKHRLWFKDDTGYQFDFPVSDLAFRELCYKRIKKDKESISDVSSELAQQLRKADRVYIRLGLARPWSNPKTNEVRCYLQVTGIYTFPDYLQGKTFADFLT